MALRAVKLVALGEASVRRFITTPGILLAQGADPVRGPGSPRNVSVGTKDMDGGEREAVTEGSESPKDMAESIKQRGDAGETDSAADLKGNPVGEADKETVREESLDAPLEQIDLCVDDQKYVYIS